MPFWRSSAATRWATFAWPTTRRRAGWGGGGLRDPANVAALRRRGLIVALTAGPDVLLARLGADGGGRPLLPPDPRARGQTLRAERAPPDAPAHPPLRPAGPPPAGVTVPEGERAKSLRTASAVYDQMAAAGVDRRAVVVGLGGGGAGDLAGHVR